MNPQSPAQASSASVYYSSAAPHRREADDRAVTTDHHPEDFISRSLKLHSAQEAAAYASLTVPWHLRPINEPTSNNSMLRVLGSKYLWWKVMYALRMAFVAMLPVAALIAAESTTGAFVSKAFATSGALITAVETFGGSLNATWAWFKCLPICLPLLTLYTYIELYNDPYAWGVVYVATLALGAFLCENLTRRLSLLLTTVVMVGQLRARYDGHGKGMELSFPTRLAAEYTLGCFTGILATLLPWPRYAAGRVDKKLAEAASNLSLCFSGLCDSFWTETNMQRKANMVRIDLAKKTALNSLSDAHHCLEVCRFEPQAREHLLLRQAKNELLSSYIPIVDSALRLLEAITDDQSVLKSDPSREAFGGYMSEPLKELAGAMDAALFLISRASRFSDLYPAAASRPATDHGHGKHHKKDEGGKSSGTQDQSNTASWPPLWKSRRDQQRPVVGMGMGLHPIRRVKLASLKLEAAYARARRDLFYSSNRRAATITITPANLAHELSSHGQFRQQEGQQYLRSPQRSPAMGSLSMPHSRRASMAPAPLILNNKSGFSSFNDVAMHGVTPTTRSAALATSPTSGDHDMTDTAQEYAAFMSYYMFTLSQFGKRTVRFPSQASARVRRERWAYVFWRDEVMASFYSSMRYFQEFASFCFPCCSGWSFLSEVPFNKRLHAAVKLREAIKVSVAMGLCVLFYYYTDRDYAFFGGPGIVAFIAANTTAEALAGSLVRMFGTLFGGVMGFFCARLTTTPVEKVSALMILMLVFGFFRTGKQYGFGAVYGCFVIVPMLGANVESDEAISRIIQITFAALIYTFVSAAIFPARPLVELQMARSSAIVAISDSLQRVIRAAVAPFPPSVRLDKSLALNNAIGCGGSVLSSSSSSPQSPSAPHFDSKMPAIRRVFGGGLGTIVGEMTPPLKASSSPMTARKVGGGGLSRAATPTRDITELRSTGTSGGIGSSGGLVTRGAFGSDALWEADEEDWDLMEGVVDGLVFHSVDSALTLAGDADGGVGAADHFTDARGRLRKQHTMDLEEATAMNGAGRVGPSLTMAALGGSNSVQMLGTVNRLPNSATESTMGVTAVTVARPADVPTRLAMANDPFIAVAEAAAVALDTSIKKAAEWMPFAETEPMLTRVPYPSQLSKDTHDSLLKLRALVDLMLDAVKSLRLRHSDPSPIFLAVFDDLEPHLIECVHLFYSVVDMVVVSLTRRHAGLADAMIAASLRLEQKCAEAHHVKALGLMQLVKLGRIISDVIPLERERQLQKAGKQTNTMRGTCAGAVPSSEEEEREKEEEQIREALMCEYRDGRFPGAVWQWSSRHLEALAMAMVREVFEPDYYNTLIQQQENIGTDVATYSDPLRSLAAATVPHQEEDARRTGPLAEDLAPINTFSEGRSGHLPPVSNSNNNELLGNKSFTGFVVESTRSQARPQQSSVMAASAASTTAPTTRQPAVIVTAADLIANAALNGKSTDYEEIGGGGHGTNVSPLLLPHGRKLKLLMTNADALGLHTLTLSLVIFSKEVKRVIMSVEGLQQHMLLVT